MTKERHLVSLIVSYLVKSERNGIEKLLRRFIDGSELPQEEIDPGEEKLLSDMVRQNILYFDPTEAKYYPQGKRIQRIKLQHADPWLPQHRRQY